MDLHVITPRGSVLVVQVVDGRVVLPPENAPQTHNSAETAGHESEQSINVCGA